MRTHMCSNTPWSKVCNSKDSESLPRGNGSANHRADIQELGEAEKEGGSSDMKDGPRLVLSEEHGLRTPGASSNPW